MARVNNDIVLELRKVDQSALDNIVPSRLKFGSYEHFQMFDQACQEIVTDPRIRQAIDENLVSELKRMIELDQLSIKLQKQAIDVFSKTDSYWYKYNAIAIPLLQNNIERLQNAGYDSLVEAREVGVLVDSNGEESVANWPILEKGQEIADERTFGGLLQKLAAEDTDDETRARIKDALNMALQGETADAKELIKRAIAEVIVPPGSPHMLRFEENENGDVVLDFFMETETVEPVSEQKLVDYLYRFTSPINLVNPVVSPDQQNATIALRVPDDQKWELRIFNTEQQMVRSVGDTGPGVWFKWNLKNTQGETVPDGRYTVQLIYKDEHGREKQVPGNRILTIERAEPVEIEPEGHTVDELLALDSVAFSNNVREEYMESENAFEHKERIMALEQLFSKREVLSAFRDRRERLCAHDPHAPDSGARDLEWLVRKFPWHNEQRRAEFFHALALEMFAMSRRGDNFGLLNYAYKDAQGVSRPLFFATYGEALCAATYLEEELRYMSKEQLAELVKLMSPEAFKKTGEDFRLNHFFRHVLEQYELSIKLKEPLGDRWVPKYARVKAEGEHHPPVILVKEKFNPAQPIGSPERKRIQFSINGGDDLAMWSEIEDMGIHIPDDVKTQEGFHDITIASLPPDRVRFKDGVVEILEEAPKEKK